MNLRNGKQHLLLFFLISVLNGKKDVLLCSLKYVSCLLFEELHCLLFESFSSSIISGFSFESFSSSIISGFSFESFSGSVISGFSFE